MTNPFLHQWKASDDEEPPYVVKAKRKVAPPPPPTGVMVRSARSRAQANSEISGACLFLTLAIALIGGTIGIGVGLLLAAWGCN